MTLKMVMSQAALAEEKAGISKQGNVADKKL